MANNLGDSAYIRQYTIVHDFPYPACLQIMTLVIIDCASKICICIDSVCVFYSNFVPVTKFLVGLAFC